VAISYNGVAVSLAGGPPVLLPVHELRYNTAVQARVHLLLERVRRGEVEPAAALAELQQVEAGTPRHSRWVAVLILGAAAVCLALLLGADAGAAAVAGVAAGLGLAVRQELGRRHVSLLALPLTAAFLGAALGGIVIRLDWTRTPGLALIVPSLMLVPGPHLLNGLMDLIDNYLPMSLARLGLALGILLASTLGVVLGIELMLGGPPNAPGGLAGPLPLPYDVLLAGVVTCGFAVVYNTAWPQVALAALGGMTGHGLRWLALDAGARPEAATLLGGLAVGAAAAWMARSYRTPVAVIAFAGAVTMMPGIQLYRALGGALQLARLDDAADLTAVTAPLGNALQAGVIVGALSLGLIVGARALLVLAGERGSQAALSIGSDPDQSTQAVVAEGSSAPKP
jgi:uncharacterized membrane protein YjjB (DUF3815 family)